MKPKELLTYSCFLAFFMAGCATASSDKNISGNSPKKEAQTAIVTIADTIKGEAVSAKYCPVCGRHYSSSVKVCPKDGAVLKEVHD